jgi:hypothetical protein
VDSAYGILWAEEVSELIQTVHAKEMYEILCEMYRANTLSDDHTLKEWMTEIEEILRKIENH